MNTQREYILQEAIQGAVTAADRIILDASDGSVEETNFLTARVAEEFVKKTMIPLNHALCVHNMHKEKEHD